MTPAPAPDLCAACGEAYPILCTLRFRRGKTRLVCPLCLAGAIQDETGFRVVNVVRRMFEAKALGPSVSAAYKEAQRQLRAEAAALNG